MMNICKAVNILEDRLGGDELYACRSTLIDYGDKYPEDTIFKEALDFYLKIVGRPTVLVKRKTGYVWLATNVETCTVLQASSAKELARMLGGKEGSVKSYKTYGKLYKKKYKIESRRVKRNEPNRTN